MRQAKSFLWNKSKEEKIEVEGHQKDQSCVKGQDIAFTVNFKQTYGSKPDVKWYFNNKEVSSSERVSHI